MWPRTDFLELLGLTHPIVQAPMSGLTPATLAAAVCNAGALGSIGCALLSPAVVREQVITLRQATNRPFNLNFFVHARPRTTAQATARVRGRLTPYFDEFGLGPVPEPKEPFPTFDEERLEPCPRAPAAGRQLSFWSAGGHGDAADQGRPAASF